MVFLLFCTLGLSTPPNFPQLPPDYEWKDYYPYDVPREYCEAYLPGYKLPVLTDTFCPPYNLELNDLKFDVGKGDSLYGWVRYTANPRGDLYNLYDRDWSKGIIQVDWGVHKEQELTPEAIMNYFLAATGIDYARIHALKEKKVEQISIGEKTAYRVRSYWWHSYCDGGYHEVGSLTFYFIPTERWDFQISCGTCIYTFTAGPPPGLDPEVTNSLRAIWEPEKTYPNNIAELEQAVEQSFRVKE